MGLWLSMSMELLLASSSTSPGLSSHFTISNINRNPTISQVRTWKSLPVRTLEARFQGFLLCIRTNTSNSLRRCSNSNESLKKRFLLHRVYKLNKSIFSLSGWFCMKYTSSHKVMSCSEKIRQRVSALFVQLVVAVLFVTSVSVAVRETSSWALSEENQLFLEAWRTIDRAYIDKTFNGQNMAIRKMLATLDDPFTRFLEPEKFNSLRSGTRGALTGVGLSIGYPTGSDKLAEGLVVISAAPGGPANRAGILSGDVILAIDDTSTESMGIYDAAERLQGPEGSSVELTIRSGPEIKHLALRRERVSLNPVKSRMCEIPGSGKDSPRIGYIKLTSFNQNASGAVREAIDTLRSNSVSAFVLDLRDNSGGLFPEGIEIAKIW
ncbi:hypothetical protein Patl1_25748 [Pistacia atlantica]|uniref:Uncharacterized protein n=1 Tax=Pistacia atlantica TaxID=434234 RepID=A0ACC1B4P4_9ROSI|nr:hypothetical protein Patl1_25748 [Pistacia atlantica]